MATAMSAEELTSRVVQLEVDSAVMREDVRVTKGEIIDIFRQITDQKQGMVDAIQVEFAKANSRIDVLINDTGAELEKLKGTHTASITDLFSQTQHALQQLDGRMKEVASSRSGEGGGGGPGVAEEE